MAQIVCIDTGTLNTEINEIDDIVAIHDDDVELSGSGYENFKVIKVYGKTKAEIDAIFKLKRPEQNRAIKVSSADKWCFLEEKEVWKNDKDKWCDLINNPRHSFSIQDVTEADRLSLADKEVTISTKNVILDKVVEKIHLDAKNLIEVADLNSAVITEL